jgi:hypothetical protein
MAVDGLSNLKLSMYSVISVGVGFVPGNINVEIYSISTGV